VDRSTASSVGDLERGLYEADRILGYQRIPVCELNALREELRQAKHKLDALQKEQPNTLAFTKRKLESKRRDPSPGSSSNRALTYC